MHRFAGALGQAFQVYLATLITSMLLTMPEEISNIFKVRRYLPVSLSCAAYPRLTRLPNRRWVVLLAR